MNSPELTPNTESALSDLSREALGHGLTLDTTAIQMHLDYGLTPPLSTTLVTPNCAYDLFMGQQPNPAYILGNLVTGWFGKPAYFGASMHTTETPFADPTGHTAGYSFVTRRIDYHIPGHGKFTTDVFQPTGELRYGLAVNKHVPESEGTRDIAAHFLGRFLELTPDNILVIQRDELSETETFKAVEGLFDNFKKIAGDLGTSVNDLPNNPEMALIVRFKLHDDGTFLQAKLKPYTMQDSITKRPIHWPALSITVFNTTQSGVRQLSLDGLKYSKNLRKIYAHRSSAGSNVDEPLSAEDIKMLMVTFSELASVTECGQIIPSSDHFIENQHNAPQQIAPISTENIDRIRALLSESH